jgi:hypothetical protein
LQAMRTGAARAAPVPGAVDPFDLDGATVLLELPNSLGGQESAATTAVTTSLKKPAGVTRP